MSSTTIRDVLVKIALQTDTKGFKVPDFANLEKQLEKVKKAFGDIEQQAKEALKSVDTVAARAAESSKIAADAVKRHKESNDKLTQSTEKLWDAEKKRSEIVAQLASGALQTARGLAFLTAANEEDYQSMLRLIAKYQGAFDLLNGLNTFYKTYVDLKKAAATATKAEAAAETLVAAARSKSAIAGAFGSLGGGNLLRYAGMAGRFAAPIGAGLAVGYVLGKAGAYGIDQLSGTSAMRSRDQRQADYYSDGAITERQQAGMQAMNRFFDQNRNQLGLNLEVAKSRFDRKGTPYDQRMAFYDRQINEQEGKLLFTQQVGGSETQQVEAARRVLEYQKTIQQVESQRLEDQRARESMLKTELQIAQQILEKSNATLRSAQGRFDSEEARFGRLEKFEQERLIALGKKVREGTADDSELREFDQSGFGRELTDSTYKGKGKAAGYELLASVVGDDKELQQAQRDFRAAQASAGESMKESAEMGIETWKSVDKTVEKLFDAMKSQQSTNAEIRQRLEEMERESASRRLRSGVNQRYRNS